MRSIIMHSNHEVFNIRATASAMLKVPSDGLKSQHFQAFYFKNSQTFYLKERVSTMPKVSSDGFRLP
jgi:hypothetical protein